MASTSNVKVEVGAPRRHLGDFARVVYDETLVNQRTARIGLGNIRVRLEWLHNSLSRILVENNDDEASVKQILGLGKCELLADPSPR